MNDSSSAVATKRASRSAEAAARRAEAAPASSRARPGAPAWVVAKRELAAYFATPVAYVFIVIFLMLSGFFTFFLGEFLETGQADLSPFFQFHPWLYLFLMPAIAMRLWAEERRSGTLELLLTLPITTTKAVVGKFVAAWLFAGIALALTFPVWMTVAFLGEPDHGVIAGAYAGSFVMAGAFLAIGSCVSAMTKNQVIAFVVGVVISFFFLLSGIPAVKDFLAVLPGFLERGLNDFSILTHFDAISHGVVDARDLLYFASLIVFFLFANVLVLEIKKAD